MCCGLGSIFLVFYFLLAESTHSFLGCVLLAQPAKVQTAAPLKPLESRPRTFVSPVLLYLERQSLLFDLLTLE